MKATLSGTPGKYYYISVGKLVLAGYPTKSAAIARLVASGWDYDDLTE